MGNKMSNILNFYKIFQKQNELYKKNNKKTDEKRKIYEPKRL